MELNKETSFLLRQKQSLPLEQKLEITEKSIKEWYKHWDGDVCVSFSGGKDSTVLLDIVRKIYPEVPAVFVDTGLEFPEIREFVKIIDNVVWLKPEMNFRDVLNKYGYPVISKSVSDKIHDIRNSTEHMRQTRLHGTQMERLPKKWLFMLKAPFKISDKCCNVIKKKPLRKYQDETNKKPFIGMMASEGRQRQINYIKYGCNMFSAGNPTSNPLSIWLEQDIWEYIKKENLPVSKIYEMGYDRTGCMFCMFGLNLQKHPNKFELMKITHPLQYKYCMEKLGLEKIINFIEHKGRTLFS